MNFVGNYTETCTVQKKQERPTNDNRFQNKCETGPMKLAMKLDETLKPQAQNQVKRNVLEGFEFHRGSDETRNLLKCWRIFKNLETTLMFSESGKMSTGFEFHRVS